MHKRNWPCGTAPPISGEAPPPPDGGEGSGKGPSDVLVFCFSKDMIGYLVVWFCLKFFTCFFSLWDGVLRVLTLCLQYLIAMTRPPNTYTHTRIFYSNHFTGKICLYIQQKLLFQEIMKYSLVQLKTAQVLLAKICSMIGSLFVKAQRLHINPLTPMWFSHRWVDIFVDLIQVVGGGTRYRRKKQENSRPFLSTSIEVMVFEAHLSNLSAKNICLFLFRAPTTETHQICAI